MTTPTTPDHGLDADLLGIYVEQVRIDQAVDAIRAFCGWHVWPAHREVLTIDGEGGRVLSLPSLRLLDVEEVVENGDVIDNELYEWSGTGDIKRLDRCWTSRWRGIEVTVNHGYAECPFAGVVGGIASSGTSPEVIGPFQFTGGDASAAIMPYRDTLSLYRIPVVP